MNWQSERISSLAQSDIRAMTQECIRVGGINLGQGLCELPTPGSVVKASQQALADGEKGIYSPPEGIAPLRQSIAKKLKNENHLDYDPDSEIVVTVGATGGYAATLMSLFNPGDELLLFEPYYGYHLNTALLAEVKPKFVPFRSEDLSINEHDIRNSISPATKALVVCTPNNPSGKMWTAEEIETLAKIATEKDLLVITDEMYEFFRYDGRQHISPASHPRLKNRTVTMMGLSKTYSMTGWRLGYIAAPKNLAEKIRVANDLFYACAPTPLQYGVLAGFELSKSYYDDLEVAFTRKRDKICDTLVRVGMPPVIPQGAYYVLADISKFGMADSKIFAMSLLEEAQVATVPGRAFFQSEVGDKFIRLCFAVEDDKLDEACKRISNFKGGHR